MSARIELPCGPTAADRDALLAAIAESLLEIHSWPAGADAGESSHLILDTAIGGMSFYVQFLSKPAEPGVLCEVSSGFYQAPTVLPTPAQREAMVSGGFTDGRAGNFAKQLALDGPEDARTNAVQTLSLMGSVFGWEPGSRLTAQVTHCRLVARSTGWADDPDKLKEEIFAEWMAERPGATREQFENEWGVVEAIFGF